MVNLDVPVGFRANEEDKAIIQRWMKKTGLRAPQVIRLALRKLDETEKPAKR